MICARPRCYIFPVSDRSYSSSGRLAPDDYSGGSSPSNRLAADSPVSSSTCTYRAVVRRSAWPSRCITAFGFSPASISHEACVCRTW